MQAVFAHLVVLVVVVLFRQLFNSMAAAGGGGGPPPAMNQADINAAIVASLQYIAANPVQGLNISSATSILHVLQTMRKFDGSYSAAIWLTDFDQERATYNLDDAWAIRNIDRVLEGTAATWWKSQRNGYLTRSNVQGANAATIYNELKASMNVFFSEDSIKERARIENEHVRFNFNDDPVQYVARKIDVLTRMNPSMTVKEQVMQLLIGLPNEVRMLVSPGDVDTVDKFSSKLSMQLALHRRSFNQSSGQPRTQPSQVQYRKVGVQRGKNSQRKPNANKPIPGLTVPQFSDEHKANCVDADGNRVCWHCQKKGHTVRSCFKLAREQGIPIPNKENSSGPSHQQQSEN